MGRKKIDKDTVDNRGLFLHQSARAPALYGKKLPWTRAFSKPRHSKPAWKMVKLVGPEGLAER